jgi:hypothetical protein
MRRPPTISAVTCPRWLAEKRRSTASDRRNMRPERTIAAARASAPRPSTHDELAKPPKIDESGASPVAPQAAAISNVTTKSGTGSRSQPTAAPSTIRITCQPCMVSPVGGDVHHSRSGMPTVIASATRFRGTDGLGRARS